MSPKLNAMLAIAATAVVTRSGRAYPIPAMQAFTGPSVTEKNEPKTRISRALVAPRNFGPNTVSIDCVGIRAKRRNIGTVIARVHRVEVTNVRRIVSRSFSAVRRAAVGM